jgi:hypothetical protein
MEPIDKSKFIQQGWKVDPMLPPGFFYPNVNDYPHLHLTCVLREGKPYMAYLGYTISRGNSQAIFKDGQWDQKIVDAISDENIKKEANFAKQYK